MGKFRRPEGTAEPERGSGGRHFLSPSDPHSTVFREAPHDPVRPRHAELPFQRPLWSDEWDLEPRLQVALSWHPRAAAAQVRRNWFKRRGGEFDGFEDEAREVVGRALRVVQGRIREADSYVPCPDADEAAE